MKSIKYFAAPLAILLASFACQSMTVNSSEIYRIEFRLPPRPSNELVPVDTIFLGVNTAPTEQIIDASASLFNGITLLGTSSRVFAAGSSTLDFYWSGTDSALTYSEATRIDAASLIDRSIIGQIDIRLSWQADVGQSNLNAGYGIGTAVRVDGENNAYVTGVSVIPASVPEPTSIALMLLGMVALIAACGGHKNRGENILNGP